jgi:hypothetical protein
MHLKRNQLVQNRRPRDKIQFGILSQAQERVPKVEEKKSWGRMSVKWSVQNKTKDQTSGSVKEEEGEDNQPLKSLAFSSLDGMGWVGLPCLTLS